MYTLSELLQNKNKGMWMDGMKKGTEGNGTSDFITSESFRIKDAYEAK